MAHEAKARVTNEREGFTKVWDNWRLLGDIQKSPATKIQVAMAVRNGIKYIVFREFFHRKTIGEWKPGRDGISIPYAYPLEDVTQLLWPVKEILELVQANYDAFNDFALYDPEAALYTPKKEKGFVTKWGDKE